MRRSIIFLLLLAAGSQAYAQENLFLIQGGSAGTSGSTVGTSLTGLKVNAAWEFQPMGDKWTMGGSIGYVQLSADLPNGNVKVTSIPIAFVGRYMVGGEKFKGFLRGSVGTQISSASYTGALVSPSNSQWGMTASIAGGIMYWASDKIFISAEYEFLWLSNAIADSGSVGCVLGGIGYRF